jgi:hypothetical protein
MMIVEDENASSPSLNVASTLDSFSGALPAVVERAGSADGIARYRFKLTSQGDTSEILAEAVKGILDDVVWSAMLRQTAEKFADIDVTSDFGTHPTHCKVEWRGGVRRGIVEWSSRDGSEITGADRKDLDWTVVVVPNDDDPAANPAGSTVIRWRLAELSSDEKDTLRRHHLLLTDAGVREQLGEAASTAVHAHTIAVDKVWQRIMIDDAALIDGEVEYRFDESVRSSHSLTQLLGASLAPIFESRYPAHPRLPVVLDTNNASVLISRFLSTAEIGNPDIQRLAEGCAAPLGLAIKEGDLFVPTAEDVVADLAVVRAAFEGLGDDPAARISLDDLAPRMQASPYGLSREARQLIAAALVAQRQYEFVTTSGDRINHRSLDLRIVWDDIAGLAKPLNELYSDERLVSWARSLGGNSEISSVNDPAQREIVVNALSEWLSSWRTSGVLDRFDSLPDENLSAGVWRTAAGLRKTYGAIADSVATMISDDGSLEQCLQDIADLFSDSEDEFRKKGEDFKLLTEFIAGTSVRNKVLSYLSVCESTADPEIEIQRQELITVLNTVNLTAEALAELEGLWAAFKARYIGHYVGMHDSVMSPNVAVPALQQILDNEAWPVFDNLSKSTLFDHRYSLKAKKLMRELRQLYCHANVEYVLETAPTCTCSFELGDQVRLAAIPASLRETIEQGIENFRSAAASKGILKGDEDLVSLSGLQLRNLIHAAGGTFSEPETQSSVAAAETPPNDAGDWEAEFEQLEVFANT